MGLNQSININMQMMMMMRRQPQPSQMVISELEQSFTIVKIEDSATELPAGLEALAVIHPQNVSNKLQFAIDQFILAANPSSSRSIRRHNTSSARPTRSNR